MSSPNLFVPITKVDVARREVWGRAAHQVPDQTDEMFNYLGSKPHFQEWSKSFSDATDGKSLGNIRAMHGKVAAGKAIAMNFNDADEAIDIGTKIVDDGEWNKCVEGVYTGFSIGGSYVGEKVTQKVNGKDVKFYIAKPNEISLVDNPCIPTAKFFDIVKADGVIEKVAFKEPPKEDDKAKIGEVAKTVSEPIEVAGTDAQVADFGKALNDAKFTLTDAIEAIDVLVTKRADAGKTPEPPAPPTAEVMLATFTAMDEAAKTAFLGELGKLAPADPLREVLDQAMSVGAVIKRVSDPELPMTDLADIAKTQLTDDERKTLKSIDDVRNAIVAKAKGSMTAANKDRLQAAHDHLAAMGADCDGDADKTNPTGELVKSVAALQDQVAKLNARPATHVMLRAVSKEQASSGTQTADGTTTKRDPLKEMTVEQLTKFQRADGTIDFDAARDELNKTAA